MWINYNPNPAARNVGDCSVRAITKALDIDWEIAFALIATNAFAMCDMPSSDAVWGSVLRQHGFTKHIIPNTCPDCYTIADFAEDNPVGTFVVGTGSHVVCVKDGDIYDSWDSSNEIGIYYWTYKERGWSMDEVENTQTESEIVLDSNTNTATPTATTIK